MLVPQGIGEPSFPFEDRRDARLGIERKALAAEDADRSLEVEPDDDRSRTPRGRRQPQAGIDRERADGKTQSDDDPLDPLQRNRLSLDLDRFWCWRDDAVDLADETAHMATRTVVGTTAWSEIASVRACYLGAILAAGDSSSS